MSDARYFGIMGLLLLSALFIGFVLGWNSNPDDSHDGS